MESPNPEISSRKRKRSPIDERAASRLPRPPVGHGIGIGNGPANVTHINYLMQARGERLRLIEGDPETFSDVLGMIDDYESR
jgi:hypothetical protein